jgi:hypothetical protein
MRRDIEKFEWFNRKSAFFPRHFSTSIKKEEEVCLKKEIDAVDCRLVAFFSVMH